MDHERLGYTVFVLGQVGTEERGKFHILVIFTPVKDKWI